MKRGLILKEGTVLVIIDVQEKLFSHMVEKVLIVKNLKKLINLAKIMKISIVLTEQYPKGLGSTIPQIKRLLPAIDPIEKIEFSCLGSDKFNKVITELKAKTLIVAGIEAHICVTQTAIEALSNGYVVCVVSDAISSRIIEDKITALERMRHEGVVIVSTEMLIYELLKKAGTPEFKEMLKYVK